MEQDASMGLAEHGGVVVGIARGNDAVVEALQRNDRLTLGVLLTQLIVHDAIGFVSDQAVTKQRREPQLAHQRLRELVEGVGQDHHLEALAQPVDELRCAFQWLQRRNHLLDVGELQAVLIEDAQALLHQHVVVGNVPRGRPERFDSGGLGKGDPDFRNQHTFQVETGYFHGATPQCRKLKAAL